MKCLVYASFACIDFSENDLAQLATDAAARNAESGVTGYLYFDNGRFMQYIEGEAWAIDLLIGRIERDTRHTIKRVVMDNDLETRRFPTWHMQWLKQGSLVNIRLEHILHSFLLLKTAHTSRYSMLEARVWQLVDKIADRHGINQGK